MTPQAFVTSYMMSYGVAGLVIMGRPYGTRAPPASTLRRVFVYVQRRRRGYRGTTLRVTSVGLPGFDQAALVGQDDRLDPVADPELGEQVAHMGLHGGLADVEGVGDLGVREALRQQQ